MKKALSLLAALSLMLSFTACGDSGNAGTDGSTADANTSSEEVKESESESESEAEPPSDGTKEQINVYSFTNEVPDMVQKYIDTHPDFAAKYEMNDT